MFEIDRVFVIVLIKYPRNGEINEIKQDLIAIGLEAIHQKFPRAGIQLITYLFIQNINDLQISLIVIVIIQFDCNRSLVHRKTEWVIR